MMDSVTVLAAGLQTLFQDDGRRGYAHLGIGHAGAADAYSYHFANTLVANPETAVALEIAGGDFALRFNADAEFAVTGAAAEVTLNNTPVAINTRLRGNSGQVLRIAPPHIGFRNYIAVAGGFAVSQVINSAATDTLAEIGPPPITPGQQLPVANSAPCANAGSTPATVPLSLAAGTTLLRVYIGPRNDWFTVDSLRYLLSATYVVRNELSRVGVRLSGPALVRSRSGELISEGVTCGAIQVAHDGQPIIFLADHPVTGGYPVVAVVKSADLPQAAQLRPGTNVRFGIAFD